MPQLDRPVTELPPSTPRGFLGTGTLLEWLTQVLIAERAAAITLAVAIALALLAPLGPLASNRFHRDEAIYSSWGLDIASGRDLLVSGSAVDKPPLFLYTQALSFLLFGPTEVAARLPSLIASVVSVGLVYELGRLLYGRGVGLLAGFLLAASPFTILFAPTAFTDPMMVAWILAGCLAAVRQRWGQAGIFLGLAGITKPQGIFFVPLALGLGHISNLKSANLKSANLKSQVVAFVVSFVAVLSLALSWDVARARQPGFLAQSMASYGGLSLTPGTVWEHLLGFCDLLRYGTGSPVLNRVLSGGLPLLVMVDILGLTNVLPWREFDPLPGPFPYREREVELAPPSLIGRGDGGEGHAWVDLALLTFIALFLASHSLVAFQVWDRYLLGLVPLLALLLARVLTLPQRLVKHWPLLNFLSTLFVLGMLTFTLRPIRDAAASRFPIGGDHGAYQGIEQVVAYLQAVPADTTLYHRWLGWHWRFYLWGSPYDFRAWTSAADLAAQAAARLPGLGARGQAPVPGAQGQAPVPGARGQANSGCYVVFPSWHSPTEARLALADAGLVLHEVQRAFRDDGSVSFIVYRIEEAQ